MPPSNLSLRRVAVAVRGIEKARTLYESVFGAEFSVTEGDGVRYAEWRREGEPVLELVEPRDEDSAIARFIRKRGEGVHHLSFAVGDLEAAVRSLGSAGARVVRTPSYYRSPGGGALTEAFLHPKDASGVLFHLFEE